MDFKNIDKKYRPVPFWSWNEKLNTEETKWQIGEMDNVGIGGFFMHARGGLQTEYMGDEWFDNVGASIDEANERGMHAWAYDENGWPSGFGGGAVNGLGEEYQQKYLRVKTFTPDLEDPRGPRVISCFENYCFYYDVNPFYVDTLDGKVIKKFIDVIYVPYYEKYKDSFDGFFTDEPQISRNGIPWSLTLPAEYEKEYGENLYDRLIELFIERGDYVQTRIKFWRLITMLFSKNYMKQIYDWCTEHNLKFTGHMVLEETFHSQITSNGACMPHYEYMHIPGMDWLCRPIYRCLTMHQLASTAAQTGKKQILSETFALCGHNVSHEELKRNYEWMMVRGINLMCQHLEGYSLRGIRKRDYPPAMYLQQPWWADYKTFNDAMSRIGMLLAEGEIKVDTLVMHTETSAWICYNDRDNANLNEYNEILLNIIDELEKKHIQFHLGDEIMLERHGRVEGRELVIGQQRYSRIIIPKHIAFFENTDKLLAEFRANGGQILTADEIPANNIIDNTNITYTTRGFDGFRMHYFVNSTSESQKAKINCGGKILNIATGGLEDFYGEYEFPAMGSLVVIDDGQPHAKKPEEKKLNVLDLSGKWDVSATANSLTLDKCTYWFDGKLQEEDGYVLNVAQRAYELGKPVNIKCEFKVNAEYIPEKLMLACETPEIFDIEVNGKAVDKTDCGYFRDKAFRLLNISGLMTEGENVITIGVYFKQSEQVYENMKNAKVFESEKNKLTYDMELETLYLVGDFAVRNNGTYDQIPNDAYFFGGDFTLVKPEGKIELHNIDRQGYTFFSGELTFKKKFKLDSTDYKVVFNKKGINAIRIKVNGKQVKVMLWTPYELDISEYLTIGENEIEITAVNNLRNLLGPLHHAAGELLAVGPNSFFYEPCIWNGYYAGGYTPKYCFVETSLC